MTSGDKKLAQKLIAIVVIVALLDVIGISPAVIVFFLVAGFIVWRVVRRSEHQETERVFDFYVAADEILRSDGRHWYGFEIGEVTTRGEQLLHSMPDPPLLISFALGVLYHRAGDYEAAAAHLAKVVKDELSEEHQRGLPSPQLRRYVQLLRNIEREPAGAPLALAALRSLERGRRSRASSLFVECRERSLGTSESAKAPGLADAAQAAEIESSSDFSRAVGQSPIRVFSSLTPPRPIAEVLADVYQEEKKTA